MLAPSLPCLLLAVLSTVLAAPLPVPAPASIPAAPATSGGKVFLTQEEALKLAFPKCDVAKETFYLSEAETERARELAKVDVDARIVRAYVATRDGKLVGTAYFDCHEVRTLKETVMVAVNPDDHVRRIELLAFAEPEDYIPRGPWYGQFEGKELNDELSLKRGIRGVTGATLTARATTDAARRVLALHLVVKERSGGS